MTATVQKNGRARSRVPLVAELPAPQAEPESIPAIDEPTPNLDAAVLRVQAQAGKLIRNEPGQVGSRTYMYVTLTAVTDEVLPLLVAEDLLWKAWPTVLDDGKPGLRYRMTHIPSGERDEDVMPLLTDPTMQGLGSGITYARRYALVSYLNLTIDEDDDGAAANARPPADRYADTRQNEVQNAEQNAEPPRPQAKPAKTSERPCTAPQRKMLRAKAKAAGLSTGELADVLKREGGQEVKEWSDAAAADRWLDRALGHWPARLVDAVIAGIAHAGAEKGERS